MYEDRNFPEAKNATGRAEKVSALCLKVPNFTFSHERELEERINIRTRLVLNKREVGLAEQQLCLQSWLVTTVQVAGTVNCWLLSG